MTGPTVFPILAGLFPLVYLSAFVLGIPDVPSVVLYVAVLVLLTGLCRMLERLGLRVPPGALCIGLGLSIVWVFSYSSLRSLLIGRTIAGIQVWAHAVLIPVWLGILVACLLLLPYKKILQPRVMGFLNLVAILMLVVPVASAAARSHPAPVAMEIPAPPPERAALGELPDIYFLVMDGYGGESELKSLLNFDNSGFTDELEKRGFVVFKNAYSSYPETQLSLAAILNMTYLPMERIGDNRYKLLQDRQQVVQAITDSAVHRYLKSAGYRILDLSIWPGAGNSNCIEGAGNPLLGALSLQLVHMTPLARPLAQNLLSGIRTARSDDCRFRELAQLPPDGPPRFVYLHSMTTHPPFTLTASGSLLPLSTVLLQKQAEPGMYLDQIRAVNRKILRVVDQVQSNRGRHAIIVLVGDHGPAMPLSKETSIRLRQSILSAWYFQDSGALLSSRPVAPVNTFRYVLNRYFGLHAELLEERNFRSGGDLETLIEVTQDLPLREPNRLGE